MTRTGIDWEAQPLGQISDPELGRRLGVTGAAVKYQRDQRGIPPWRPTRAKCDPDVFTAELDGTASDREIAESHGLTSAQVAAARRKMGRMPKRGGTLRALARELGTAPDHAIAKRYDYDFSYVSEYRKKHGIAPWSARRVCPCGEPFVAVRQTFKRFCSYQCQRYHWQLVNVRPKVAPEVADCMLAIWRYKRTLKKGHLKHVG